MAESIDVCGDRDVRAIITAPTSSKGRAAAVLFWQVMAPAAFSERPPLFHESGDRRAVLDLPLRPGDFTGAALPQEDMALTS